jgi:hypothetical protein
MSQTPQPNILLIFIERCHALVNCCPSLLVYFYPIETTFIGYRADGGERFCSGLIKDQPKLSVLVTGAECYSRPTDFLFIFHLNLLGSVSHFKVLPSVLGKVETDSGTKISALPVLSVFPRTKHISSCSIAR